MKKIVSLLVLVTMLLSLVGCTPKPAAPKEVTYTLGMGVSVSLESSKTGTAQFDSTVAGVVTDADGKIVCVRIDVAQNKAPMADGELNLPEAWPTKAEKKFDYNMKNASALGLEWFEQVNQLQEWFVGKTAADVTGIVLEEKNGHQVAVDSELYGTCSMDLTEFKEAIIKALNDDAKVTFTVTEGTEWTLGVACNTKADGACKNATAEEDGVAAIYTEFATAVVVDGKVAACLVDEIQPKVGFDANGEVTSKTFKGTKRELKEGYNMVAYSEATLEWYQQSANFTKYVTGMTPAEIEAIKTVERNDGIGHDGYVVAEDKDLFAQCSIQITGMKAIVVKAANNK